MSEAVISQITGEKKCRNGNLVSVGPEDNVNETDMAVLGYGGSKLVPWAYNNR